MWASNPSTYSTLAMGPSNSIHILRVPPPMPPQLKNPFYNSPVPASFSSIFLKSHKSDQVPAGWSQAVGATHRKRFWNQAMEARSRDCGPQKHPKDKKEIGPN